MLFGIVDCSTSFSPSTSASPILKLFEIRRTRSKCPRCPRAIRSCWQRSSLQRWLCGDFRVVQDCSPRYHAVPQSSEGRWPGRCCAPCVAQHLDTSHVVSSLEIQPMATATHRVHSQGQAHTLPKLPSKDSRKCVVEFNLLNPPHASLHNTTATAPQSI